MSDPQTIRDRINNAIREINGGPRFAARRELEVALDLLKGCPEIPAGTAWSPDMPCRLVPDPAPRGDAEPNRDDAGINPRGAASVTLDTIIANALSETFDRWANTVGSGEGLTESLAQALADALLAKGQIWKLGQTDYLCLLLEAS